MIKRYALTSRVSVLPKTKINKLTKVVAIDLFHSVYEAASRNAINFFSIVSVNFCAFGYGFFVFS